MWPLKREINIWRPMPSPYNLVWGIPPTATKKIVWDESILIPIHSQTNCRVLFHLFQTMGDQNTSVNTLINQPNCYTSLCWSSYLPTTESLIQMILIVIFKEHTKAYRRPNEMPLLLSVKKLLGRRSVDQVDLDFLPELKWIHFVDCLL